MMGVSWGLDRVGVISACGLAIIGAEDMRVSIVACGLAIFEVEEVGISALGFAMMGVFWVLDWVGVLSACGLAIIGAEDYSFGVGNI